MDQLLYKYAKIDLEQFAIFEENISSPIGEVKFECVVQFDYDKEHDVLCSKLIMTMKDGDKTLLRAVMCSYFISSKESVEQITIDFYSYGISTICISKLWFIAWSSFR